MEKQSRVASWAVRTVTGPILTAAGVLFLLLGGLTTLLGETGVTTLRYTLVGGLGAAFLYYGLKAVQLTEMANRVWKRGAEYTYPRQNDDACRGVARGRRDPIYHRYKGRAGDAIRLPSM